MPVRGERDDRRPRSLQRALTAGDHGFASVDLAQQIVQVGRNDFDDFLLPRFGRGNARGLENGLFSPLGIAPAKLREAADIRGGVEERLALVRVRRTRLLLLCGIGAGRRLRRAAADADLHRRRRADVGARRHRRDVTGVEDERAGAGRTRAGRRNIRGDRNRRRENVLHDPPHRRVEAAGRVERQHDELRVVARRARQTAMNILNRRGTDRAVDRQRQDRRRRGDRERRREGENTDEPRDGHGDWAVREVDGKDRAPRPLSSGREKASGSAPGGTRLGRCAIDLRQATARALRRSPPNA